LTSRTSIGSRGHIGLGSCPGTGDSKECSPYWPHIGVDGSGDAANENTSVTDRTGFVGVGMVLDGAAAAYDGAGTVGGGGM